MASRVYSIWIPETLMARIEERAEEVNVTRNRFIRDTLASSVGASETRGPLGKNRADTLVAEQPT